MVYDIALGEATVVQLSITRLIFYYVYMVFNSA